MELHKIKKLIEMAQHTDITEIEVGTRNKSVRIIFVHEPPKSSSVYESTSHPQSQTQMMSTTQDSKMKCIFKSPMVGKVHLTASQGTKPFVEIGQKVKIGDVLCLIEAMSMFHQIESDRNGTISKILIDSESAVEFDQPLFEIEFKNNVSNSSYLRKQL